MFFFLRFYILYENFSKIGPIIKKIPKFQSDPLKSTYIYMDISDEDDFFLDSVSQRNTKGFKEANISMS